MPSATATPTPKVRSRQHRGRLRAGILALLVIVAAIALGGLAFLSSRKWPFDRTAVIQNLQEATDSQVQVRAFRRTYFPYPGCVLDGVAFVHGDDAGQPLATIEKLVIKGAYSGLLTSRVSRITAEKLRVFIPPFGTGKPFRTQHSTTTIGKIVADGASLEFASKNPENQPLRFDFHQASFSNVGWEGPLTYHLKVHNPEPPGEVTTTGKFGVWDKDDPGKTPISGEYTFEKADLGIYHGIAGMLSSTGKFGGNLGHIDISGTTLTPDFQVRSGGHPVKLTTEFTAYVDATHGDTFLKRVDAQFRKTHVVAQGSIAESAKGNGKTALIDLRSSNGRIEDILGLFVKKDKAPMSGAVTLHAQVEIPPGEQPFLKKVKLKGAFGIGAGQFSKPSTQEGVNKLSAGARGEKDPSDPETVLTDLTGQVALLNGVANFSDLSFGVPGADARMHGTYNVINHRIDLHGQMQVDSKISNTASGAKALLLKMMDPFFKKKKKGEILPVRISGTYEDPSFGLDIGNKKAQEVAPPATKPGHPH